MKQSKALQLAYNSIYVAIAVATFKHSAWGFATRIEGPEPLVDWAAFEPTPAFAWAVLTLLMWYVWGAMMAIAVDVGMFVTAREIRMFYNQHGGRVKQPYMLWLVYAVVASLSALTQMLYSVQHAAPLTLQPTTIAALQPGGWLEQLMQHTVILLPVALPGMGFLYTVAGKVRDEAEQVEVGIIDDTGRKVYDVNAFADLIMRHPSYVRRLAKAGTIGTKSGNTWQFTDDDTDKLRGVTDGRTKIGRSRRSRKTD